MKGHFYKPHCKCPGKKKKRCSCGATWSFMLDIGKDPVSGKRKQKKKGGFKTKTEAEAAAAILSAELSQGTFIEEKNITFEQFSKQWLAGYESTGKVKISTINHRKYQISILMPWFAKLKMKDITKKKYQDALNNLKKKYSDNTLAVTHCTGKMIFNKAVEMDIIKSDPTQFAHVPKVQKTVEELESEEETVKYLEKDELVKFLQTAKNTGSYKDYIIFKTLAYTGMRAGELCALKWKDINFESQQINITKTYYNPTNNTRKYYLLPPKTKSAVRKIDVEIGLLSEIDTHRRIQNKVKMKHRDIYDNEDFVFANSDKYPGYPEYPKNIRDRMKRILKLASLNTNLTPHSLRHTHTSLLAEAGVSLDIIIDRLGHKSDEITKNIYLHVTKPKKKEASQKFDELMGSL
ncbi:tyrosine-type recombinase/integrase [Chengkuizengella sp. SCS-71B]|uniref:tyrosine-type recombinase/integrase n=1 Tax=Chengkuizengella sp. SCS-71B TaxID=3115290 RepID=UPI0032C21EFC